MNVAAVAVLVLVLGACATEGDQSSAPPTAAPAPPGPTSPPPSSPGPTVAAPTPGATPTTSPGPVDEDAAITAIDGAWVALGITFVRPPDIGWIPVCGPGDGLLGHQLVLEVPAEPASVPSTWAPQADGGWLTPEGATVFIRDDTATITVAVDREVIDASDRVIREPQFLCG